MKKLFLAFALALGVAGGSFANGYKMDEAAIDAAFAVAQDVSFEASMDQTLFSSAVLPDTEVTKGGYYLRLCFCSVIGLHRSYMGTGGEDMWYKYLCFVCANSVATFYDFWWPLFQDEAWEGMKDNPKFFAWTNGK